MASDEPTSVDILRELEAVDCDFVMEEPTALEEALDALTAAREVVRQTEADLRQAKETLKQAIRQAELESSAANMA